MSPPSWMNEPAWKLTGAIQSGDLAAVEDLLKGVAESNPLVVFPGGRQSLALDWAVFHRQAEVVDFLLRRGADPNSRTPEGVVALITAAMLGFTDLVRLLLERGADPNHIDPDGAGTPLMAAVEDGYLDVVDLLLASGADPNIRTGDESALSIARSQGRKRVIRRLLAAGAVE